MAVKNTKKNDIFILPGNIYTSKYFFSATTILGPCISVCIWDKKLKFAGINHFMLPYWKGDGLATPKYGNIAVNKLIEQILALGSKRKNLAAKVFGGLKTRIEYDIFKIGIQNAEIAINVLNNQGIDIIAKDIGGELGRKIIFDSESSKVRVKYIKLKNKLYV